MHKETEALVRAVIDEVCLLSANPPDPVWLKATAAISDFSEGNRPITFDLLQQAGDALQRVADGAQDETKILQVHAILGKMTLQRQSLPLQQRITAAGRAE